MEELGIICIQQTVGVSVENHCLIVLVLQKVRPEMKVEIPADNPVVADDHVVGAGYIQGRSSQ